MKLKNFWQLVGYPLTAMEYQLVMLEEVHVSLYHIVRCLAVVGVTVPLVMQKLGRDPAIGSSVMITAITDSGGFFIFLGLATIFLV